MGGYPIDLGWICWTHSGSLRAIISSKSRVESALMNSFAKDLRVSGGAIMPATVLASRGMNEVKEGAGKNL
jgi:hypothetical protein